MSKPKKLVKLVRTEQDKKGNPIPIYRITTVKPVKLEMPEIKKVKL